ncbi:MAG TPA: hypothetical protein VJP87_03985 [Candidatus Acidoferrales bacterium]|nr:hypothetical protein [Candidatus Acidoferrales bacterium]
MISILLAGVSGALAALLTQLFVGFKKEKRAVSAVAVVILFLIFKTVASIYVEPPLEAWNTEREIRQIPFYNDLAVYDPATFAQVKLALRDGLRSGDSKDRVAMRITDVLAPTLPRYMPRASDASVSAYTQFMAGYLAQLDETDTEACYAVLYPTKFGRPGLATKYADDKTKQEMLAILTQIIESAMKNPQPAPAKEEAGQLLHPILAALVEKHGSDVRLLNATPRDATERKKVCDMTTGLFVQIAALPRSNGSMVLRSLMSQTESAKQ